MSDLPSPEIKKMLELNKQQAKYYDHDTTRSGLTRLWRHLRGRLAGFRRDIGLVDQIYDLHRQWLGDLSDKVVLDLGCGRGNTLSLEIARNSKEYLAIDLSQVAINHFRMRLETAEIPHVHAEVIDFLSPEFKKSFDVIYAYSVMHHFEHFDLFLQKLASHLSPGGIVVTYDPLDTDISNRILRQAYRPFQTDRAWEWPFTKRSIDEIQRHFSITELQGVLGYSKWALPLSLISPPFAYKIGVRLHEHDWRKANNLSPALWRCLHIAMLLTVKPTR